jgi:hypothetical protein
MNSSQLSQHFLATIGQLYPAPNAASTSAPGVLSHIRINAHTSFPLIGVHLGLNMSRLGHLDKEFIRKRIKEYFKNSLKDKESLRCLLEVRNEPRIDLYLTRTKGLLSSVATNVLARQLIEFWCRKDGLSLT